MNSPIDFNLIFDQVVANLNPAQKKAVEQVEGPVLVVAGPGTGKTQLLAARVGYILKTTQVNPESILCLTFTDAATVNMRARIAEFIGPVAYRVPIFTFHAFCNMVIQENLDHFGIRDLDLLSDIEEIEILHELIDAFGNNHPLKRWSGDIYYEAGRLRELFNIIKTEAWTPDLIESKAEEYIQSLPDRDEFIYKRKTGDFAKGDVKINKVKEEQEKMTQLIAAAQEYILFEKKLAERKRFTYNDMVLWVLDAFRNHENILLRYQERFQYFLVDEYQDTNGSQNELLNQLIGYWDVPNVFVVGDDDQSIYRFQGANINNILDFSKRYSKGLSVVALEENYRSSAKILETAGLLIKNNSERLVNNQELSISKNLVARSKETADSEVKPEIREYYNSVHETVDIAHEIENLRQLGVQMSEIAVIYRNHAQAEYIARYLESKEIPLNISKRFNILDSPFIKQLITILQFLQDESKHPGTAGHLLFEILHFDFFEVEGLAVDTLFASLNMKKDAKKPLAWRQAIRQPEAYLDTGLFSKFNDSIPKIKGISVLIEKWLKDLRNETLQRLFENIIRESGALSLVMQSKNQTELMQELTTFYNLIKSETIKRPKDGLKGLTNLLKLMVEYKVPLEIERFVYLGDGVNFMTAHKAKGLEFGYVFILGCQSGIWDQSPRNRTYPFPDNLVLQNTGDHTEESRRLFYVALTRAKEHLVMSYSKYDASGKEKEPSQFIVELRNFEGIEKKNIELPDRDLMQFQFAVLNDAQIPAQKLIEDAYIDKLLENYSLSVTHLSTYLQCPLSFYYKYLIKIPSAKSVAMTFGSAVHYALDQWFKKMTESPDQSFTPVDDLLSLFDWYMIRHADAFTDEEFKLKMDYGHEILPKYVAHYIKQWNKIVTTEKRIFQVVIEGVPINGIIDKIEFDGFKGNVVDYKTGKPENLKKYQKMERPTDKWKKDIPSFTEQYGGDYWRQAVFYKLLVDNDRRNPWTVVSTEFDLIEPNNKNGFQKEKVVITPEDLAAVRQQIKQAYEGIMHKSFEGCGEENCEWCNWVQSNFQGAMHLVEEEN